MTVKPISPDEIEEEAKKVIFPDAVIEAFNELIRRNYSQGYSTVQQNEVIALIIKKGLKRKDIFPNHWLDVESTYRAIGWEVTYDKPGYNETYEPSFTFRRVRKD